MIGLVLIYFVGKAFYDLAELHKKSKWGFAILGVASYYVGTFIGGMIVAVVYELGMSQSFDDLNDIVVSLMAFPLGVLTCWGFYRILKSQWSKPSSFSSPEDILDANLIDRQPEE